MTIVKSCLCHSGWCDKFGTHHETRGWSSSHLKPSILGLELVLLARLMDVKTPREINLAFLSLIKLFSEVKVEQKSISLNPKPRLPSSINAGSAQQVNTPSVSFLSEACKYHPQLSMSPFRCSNIAPKASAGQSFYKMRTCN